jgi:phosphatidylserine decarboxylase
MSETEQPDPSPTGTFSPPAEPRWASATPAPSAPASYRVPSMHPEGTKFVVAAGVLALFFWFVADFDVLGWLMAGLAIWIFTFFRDPDRVTPPGDAIIVSPADGLVCQIMDVAAPREIADSERGIGAGNFTRVSIFMSVFDVHINRAPVNGVIRKIVYVPGKFLNADLDKASDDNERQYFVVETAAGQRIGFTQIAGLVARRIVRFVNEGESVAAGQRVGLIRFGSRVDVLLPAGMAPAVLVGQRAIAGETVLARGQ